MSNGRRVVRNALFGVGSQVVGGGLYFLVAAVIARHLGPEQFGAFSFVFAMVAVLHMLADLGITNILVREIARQTDRVAAILGAVLPLVTLLAAAAYPLLILSTWFLNMSPQAEQALYIMGATVLVTFHAAVYGTVPRAFEEMHYNAIGLVSQRVVLLLLVVAGLDMGMGLPGVAVCYLGERLFQWIFFYVLVRARYAHYRWRIDLSYCAYLIKEGLPVGAGMILRRVSWYLDTFVLAALSSTISVGLFSAAYRVIQMVNVIPFTLSLPVFPLLTRMAVESPERALKAYGRTQKIFALIGLPIGMWITMLGPQIIELLFGEEFQSAGTTLQVMGLVVVVLFLNSLFVYVFSALNRQGSYMIVIGISVVLNLVLDLALIPLFDILGASLATLAAELALFLAGTFMLSRLGHSLAYFQPLARSLAAVLVAAALLTWPATSPSLLSMILGSACFAASFAILAYLWRAVDRDELVLLRNAMPGARRAAVSSGSGGDG